MGKSREFAMFIGRDREQSIVTELLAALGSRHEAAILEVAGEAGIGKTRLLNELCAQATDRNYLILRGRAAEFEGELVAFGLFLDSLEGNFSHLAPGPLQALAGAYSS